MHFSHYRQVLLLSNTSDCRRVRWSRLSALCRGCCEIGWCVPQLAYTWWPKEDKMESTFLPFATHLITRLVGGCTPCVRLLAMSTSCSFAIVIGLLRIDTKIADQIPTSSVMGPARRIGCELVRLGQSGCDNGARIQLNWGLQALLSTRIWPGLRCQETRCPTSHPGGRAFDGSGSRGWFRRVFVGL